MKRIFGVLLIIIVLTLTSCSSVGNEDMNVTTFSILYNETEENPYDVDWMILEEYLNEHNIKLDVRIGDNANYEESIALNLNNESPPDVILKVWPDTIESYANEGLLLAISDYEDLMPYYQSYIQENDLGDEVNKLKLANGKYYVLPGYQRNSQVQQWIYRKDLFELHDIPTPATYDELYDALVVLKEVYPDSTPITASWGGAHLFSMIGAGYGIPAGWSGTRYFDQVNNEWKFAPATDNYREMYRFLNKSYEANILDPAIFTQTNEEFTEKLVNGKAFATVTWISSGFDTWNQQLNDNGQIGGTWEPLPVMESTIGLTKLPPVNRFRKGLAISAEAVNKPYFEKMMEFLDWAIYSDEGNDLTYWGIEGVTYKTTQNKKQFLSHIKSSNNPDGTTTMKENGFDLIFNLCENEEFEDNKKPEEIVEFLNRSEIANDTLENPPALKLDNIAIDITDNINQSLLVAVNDWSSKFITGEKDVDSEWDDYLSELESLGYLTLETTWNNAWNTQN